VAGLKEDGDDVDLVKNSIVSVTVVAFKECNQTSAVRTLEAAHEKRTKDTDNFCHGV
jgi:hypothetical protein